jgi:hypothetical protein
MTDGTQDREDDAFAASNEGEERPADVVAFEEVEIATDYDHEPFSDAESSALAAEQALTEAREDALRTRASWSLIHKELFAFLFANCIMFAGSVVAWSAATPGLPAQPSEFITGLDTIRGSLIFALALYGFWTCVFNIYHRQMRVWPFLLNAILALWVGIGGIVGAIGSDRWKAAEAAVEARESTTLADKVLTPLDTIPPGFWLLAFGGVIVLVVLIRGIVSGAQQAKESAARAPASRRRR